MNPYPPKPIQDFPSWPEYFKVDGDAGSRADNTNFSCPNPTRNNYTETINGWVMGPADYITGPPSFKIKQEDSNQCVTPQCSNSPASASSPAGQKSDGYYFKSNFYVYGSILNNGANIPQPGISQNLANNTDPNYPTLTGPKAFEITYQSRPGDAGAPDAGPYKVATTGNAFKYNYRSLLSDVCSLSSTSDNTAKGQCFVPLSPLGKSAYIGNNGPQGSSTASPPNMVGGLDPINASSLCCGGDCSLFEVNGGWGSCY